MADSWASSAGRRRNMQANRSQDTGPELAVRKLVHKAGLRYRVAAQPEPNLRRRADLVFPTQRIAVFIDGCFWHGCPEHGRRTWNHNRDYWPTKIATNKARDLETTFLLVRSGWRVLRFWEHEDPRDVANDIIEAVSSPIGTPPKALSPIFSSMPRATRPTAASPALDVDPTRDAIAEVFKQADPSGSRCAAVLRRTYDMLYDGQNTGRFRWNELTKTEKTHFGSLFEVNFRREFDDVIDDAKVKSLLDYRVLGHDIDCKYSQTVYKWMLPPECFGHLLLVATSNDETGLWSLGIVRASDENRRETENRDKKTQLNKRGRSQVLWIFEDASLEQNILLTLEESVIAAIMAAQPGQARVTELCRLVTGQRIGRNAIATLAEQKDYMARVRDNGHGARTQLRDEGYLIAGSYKTHREIAEALGQPAPKSGEVVSFRVAPADIYHSPAVELDGRRWRLADDDEQVVEPAPKLPPTNRPKKGQGTGNG